MRQFQCAFLILCLAFVLVEPRVQLQRGLLSNADIESINQPYPYIFPHAARGRSVPRQQNYAEIAEEDYDENLEAQDDEDQEDVQYQDLAEQSPVKQMPVEHRESTGLSVPKDHSGGILVPDGIIEVQGETVYDEKTGQATLVVPMKALAAIPDGSIVALLENKSKGLQNDEDAEERANRVYVRRRNTGSRIKVRGGSKQQASKKRSSSQRRRRPQTQVINLNDLNIQDLRRRPSSSKGKRRPATNKKRRNNSKGKRRAYTKRRQPVDYFSSDY